MNSSLCMWLADIEEMLWRMVRGVFRFAFLRLPEYVWRALVDTVGPTTIRLMRVIAVFCIWLAVMFGPVVVAIKSGFPTWVCVGAVAWLVMSIAGSIWGRSCLAKRRRAAEEVKSGSACLDGLSTGYQDVASS